MRILKTPRGAQDWDLQRCIADNNKVLEDFMREKDKESEKIEQMLAVLLTDLQVLEEKCLQLRTDLETLDRALGDLEDTVADL